MTLTADSIIEYQTIHDTITQWRKYYMPSSIQYDTIARSEMVYIHDTVSLYKTVETQYISFVSKLKYFIYGMLLCTIIGVILLIKVK